MHTHTHTHADTNIQQNYSLRTTLMTDIRWPLYRDVLNTGIQQVANGHCLNNGVFYRPLPTLHSVVYISQLSNQLILQIPAMIIAISVLLSCFRICTHFKASCLKVLPTCVIQAIAFQVRVYTFAGRSYVLLKACHILYLRRILTGFIHNFL